MNQDARDTIKQMKRQISAPLFLLLKIKVTTKTDKIKGMMGSPEGISQAMRIKDATMRKIGICSFLCIR